MTPASAAGRHWPLVIVAGHDLIEELSDEKRFDTLTELSIAPLLARTIREVFENGSVTSLFNGSA